MTHKRLFLQDLTDQHLIWLRNAAIVGEKEVAEWIEEIADGSMALFEVPGGIIGFKQEPKQLFVELLAGNMMAKHRFAILDAIKELARGQPVEGFVVNPRVVKLYERMGFRQTGTFMRLDNEQPA
jgi:hypothetical protein